MKTEKEIGVNISIPSDTTPVAPTNDSSACNLTMLARVKSAKLKTKHVVSTG